MTNRWPCRTLAMMTLCVSAVSAEVPYIKIRIPNDTYTIAIIDNELLDLEQNVKSLSTKFDYVINGGYYDRKDSPSGYLKLSGHEISSRKSATLGGMLAFNNAGNMNLLWSKDLDVKQWDNVLQNGPFLVDPGGKNGIRSDQGHTAKRTCIGRYTNGDALLVFAKNSTLKGLADLLCKSEDGIEAVLNMDGGPMAGLWSKSNKNIQINNAMPAICYIGITLKAASPP